ncbi:MAG: Acetyltransferases and hydrolases with the alpha/beta hydrolase fold protein [Parcubacteria group bacterium Athens0714_25]|nr:MAG: Acetyltransferases and hydrolases with the alpha/beta hydrolase fold protein [Parcubacteria group bacterium Athens0714_25]
MAGAGGIFFKRNSKIKMKKISVSILVFLMVFSPVGFNFSHYHYSASITASSEEGEWLDYENYYVIDEDVVWSGEMDLSIELPVVVVGGATLTIEKGTKIILGESLAVYYGRIVAEGTEQERITFTSPPVDPSFFDDECFAPSRGMIEFNDRSFLAGANSSVFHYVDFVELGTYYNWNDFPDECLSSPPIIMTENWENIFSSNIAKAQSFPVSNDEEVKNPALKFVSGRLDIKNSTFKNNLYADIETYIESYPNEEKSFLQVSDSNFFGNGQNTALVSTALNYSEYSEIFGRDKDLVRFENNWYGSPGGPALAPDFSSGGEKLIGDFVLEDWSAEKFICKTCASNVLFLPGIKSSRLYKEGMLGSEDKLWIPNYFGGDMEELRMDEDEDGKSIEDVYTRDVLDEVAIPVVGGNIYKTFLEKLDGLKSGNVINDFRSNRQKTKK